MEKRIAFLTLRVGAMTYGGEVSFATQFSATVDVDVMWHHLGAKIYGVELHAWILPPNYFGKKLAY